MSGISIIDLLDGVLAAIIVMASLCSVYGGNIEAGMAGVLALMLLVRIQFYKTGGIK